MSIQSLLRLAALALAVGVSLACDNASAETPAAVPVRPIGQIERLDPALDKLVAPDAVIEVLADGLDWSEGPVWLPNEKSLVFSDVPQNVIYRWRDGDGLSVYLRGSGGFGGNTKATKESGSNGLALDHQGRLLLCQHGARRVARMTAPLGEPSAAFESIAAHYDGKRFNSPNDLVLHSSGTLFFTDPPYGLDGQDKDPSKEIPFQGVYRIDPDGEVTLLIDDLLRPNGIALSPDERTLYVAQSHHAAKHYLAYDLDEELGVSNGRVLFDANQLGETRRGSPDGIKVDTAGNLYGTGPGGVLILTPEGKHLGTLRTGTAIANCAFGDDGRTLYLTSDRYLCRVRLLATGLGF